MKTKLIELLKTTIKNLQQSETLPKDLFCEPRIEHTRSKSHGEFSTNVAFTLAKQAKTNPKELAQLIVEALPDTPLLGHIEIAGPGFINFFLNKDAQHNIIVDILNHGENFGRSQMFKNKKLILEFVSANPTGPLHVGHGRGAAYGSAVANLLEAVGYQVYREYYINDAGRQMDILAISLWLRYLEACGEKLLFPSNAYRGNYILPITDALKEKYGMDFYYPASQIFTANIPDDAKSDGSGDKEAHIDALIRKTKQLLGDRYKIIYDFGIKNIIEDIRNDLNEFGVNFQNWFSEKSLLDNNAIENALNTLRKRNYVYEKDGALWFKSTKFSDEKDRVLVRKNGQTTYFASDVAYHWNKLNRGFDSIIDVFGADHHGYVARVKASIQALGLDSDSLQIPIVQFAVLYRNGKKVQMSTRSGEFVTLRELRTEVGNDAARFFYLMRKVEQHMDFDLDLAKSRTNENPVYYIQYAHARICSLFRQLDSRRWKFDKEEGIANLNLLSTEHENNLIGLLARYPEILHIAAQRLEPHQLTNYLRELANGFHTYYNAQQFLVRDQYLRNARLCLVYGTRQILQNALTLLGISTPEMM